MYLKPVFLFLLLTAGHLSAQVTVHGHRGARGHLPENSIPGFCKALELGATYLEMDLVVSGDGQLIVSHEPWFAGKICRDQEGNVPRGKRRPLIFKMTQAEIERYDCGCAGHPNFPGQQAMSTFKPELGAVIAACDSFAQARDLPLPHYNFEVKSRKHKDGKWQPTPERFVALLAGKIRDHKIGNRVLVQSFDRRILQAMRKLREKIPLGLLVFDPRSVEKHFRLLGFVPEYFNPHHKLLNRKMIMAAHARGARVVPWTINEVAEMAKAIEMGVDGIITDFPDVAASLAETPGNR